MDENQGCPSTLPGRVQLPDNKGAISIQSPLHPVTFLSAFSACRTVHVCTCIVHRTYIMARCNKVPDDVSPSGWKFGTLSSNQQEGSDDCGVFVLMVGVHILSLISV